MKIKIAIAVGVFGLFAGHAKADPLTAGSLKTFCAAAPDQLPDNAPSLDALHAGLCVGYITGWSEGIRGLAIAGDNDKMLVINFDPKITNGQLVRVFQKYIAAHPEFESKSADEVLTHAMRDAGLFVLTPTTPARTTN